MALSDAKMVRPTLGLHLDLPRHIFYLSLLWMRVRKVLGTEATKNKNKFVTIDNS